MNDRGLDRSAAMLLAIVVVAWALTWVATKSIVAELTPFWTTAMRSGIATVALAAILAVRGQLALPRPGDLPVVAVTAVFHMIAFSTLITVGLKLVPVGRSIVLGYTTPLWVAPGAWLFLGERMPVRRVVGIGLGLAGLALMFNPVSFDWSDRNALWGNGLLLLAALAWSVSILYVRAHTWVSSPFQLSIWQTLLSTVVLGTLALAIDGIPHPNWSPGLLIELGYAGLIGTGLAFWAMNEVNRRLPATVTSLGILATPVVGIFASAAILGEAVDRTLLAATALILGGIAIGIRSTPSEPAVPSPAADESGPSAYDRSLDRGAPAVGEGRRPTSA